MKRRYLSSLAAVGFAALVYGPDPALAQAAALGPNLITYSVLGGTTVTCAGATTVTGDVGVSPGSAIVGFPAPCTNVGALRTPPAADPAQLELTTAYNTLAGRTPFTTIGPDLTGLVLVPGTYRVGAAATNLAGTLTLDTLGNPNAIFVFQMTSSLITSSGATVALTEPTCGVQWQVGSSATLGSGTTFVGDIMALTSITLNSGTSLAGRALARNGQVALNGNNVSFGACGPGPVPTLPESAAWALLAVLLASGAYLVSRRTPTEASR